MTTDEMGRPMRPHQQAFGSERSTQLSEEMYLGSMAYQTVFAGVLNRLEEQQKQHKTDHIQQLRSTLKRAAEGKSPGLLLDLVKFIVEKSRLTVNVQDSFLRLQATAPSDDLEFAPEAGAVYRELSKRALALRQVLSRVPDEMSDRRTFLETIKEIASSIKKLLDATNAVIHSSDPSLGPSLERRKREFVHYSKLFSKTLKEYFKDQNVEQVAVSANQLIFQTVYIVKTVREKRAASLV